MSVKDRIATARSMANLTQEELAERCGVHKASVYNWEHGSMPRSAMLTKIAEALDTSEEWLRTGMPSEEPEGMRGLVGEDINLILFRTKARLARRLGIKESDFSLRMEFGV